jgi:hypothetical protein
MPNFLSSLIERFKKAPDKGALPTQRAMSKIKMIGVGPLPAGASPNAVMKFKAFAGAVQKFIIDVNSFIDKYNNADVTTKEQMLRTIQETTKQMNKAFPESFIACSPEYRKMQAALFKETKYQLASLGLPLRAPHERPSPLAEIIANMAPEKADALLAILMKDKAKAKVDDAVRAKELSSLYSQDDMSDDAVRFRDFFTIHTVSCISAGNSINFKVKNTLKGSASLLKVENRFDMPRDAEDHLRRTISERFMPVDAERFVTCPDATGGMITRVILVTDYLPRGSLNEERDSFVAGSPAVSSEEMAKHTCHIFQQMAETLLNIQNAQCMFPDAKVTNWLVDDQGKFQFADFKSFLSTDKQGNYVISAPGQASKPFIHTVPFVPPECYASPNVANAGHTHAFILGLNLYYYVTGKVSEYNKLDFSHNVFKTATGQKIADLIRGLVIKNPDVRQSVGYALDVLTMLNHPEYAAVFETLEHLNAEYPFIKQKKVEMRQAMPEEKARIFKELQTKVEELTDIAVTRALEELEVLNNARDNKNMDIEQFTQTIKTEFDKMDLEEKNDLLPEIQEKVLGLKIEKAFCELENLSRDLKVLGDNVAPLNRFISAKKTAFNKAALTDLDTKAEILRELQARVLMIKERAVDVKAEKVMLELDGLIRGHLEFASSCSFLHEKNQKLMVANPDQKALILQELETKVQHLKEAKVFAELEALKICDNDSTMDIFISTKQEEMNMARSEDKAGLLQMLQETVNSLKGDQAAVQAVKDVVHHYREKAGRFTMGMHEKANRIESAMVKIPIEKRAGFYKTDAGLEVLKGLVAYRYGSHPTQESQKVPTTFQEFKKRYMDDKVAGHEDSPVQGNRSKSP